MSKKDTCPKVKCQKSGSVRRWNFNNLDVSKAKVSKGKISKGDMTESLPINGWPFKIHFLSGGIWYFAVSSVNAQFPVDHELVSAGAQDPWYLS